MNSMAAPSRLTMTASQALAAYKSNPTMAPVAILDSTSNIAKYLATLEPMAKAGRISGIALSDSKTMPLTFARYAASPVTIGLLPDRPLIIVAAVLVKDAAPTQSDGRVKSFHLTDSSANIAASLDALNNATKITVVTLTDSQPLAMTWHQLRSDTVILARIPATTLFRVADVPAASAVDAQANARIMEFRVADAVLPLLAEAARIGTMSKVAGVTVADTAGAIRANLTALAGVTRLQRIVLTDTDTLRITADQHTTHAALLSRLAPEESLAVTDLPADRAHLVADAPRVATVTVTDTLARITAQIATLDAMAESGELTAITVTDKGTTLTLNTAERTEYSHALALMAGSYTLPVTKPPVINLIWDESVALAPAAFRPAVEYAARFFDTLITSPVSINIEGAGVRPAIPRWRQVCWGRPMSRPACSAPLPITEPIWDAPIHPPRSRPPWTTWSIPAGSFSSRVRRQRRWASWRRTRHDPTVPSASRPTPISTPMTRATARSPGRST